MTKDKNLADSKPLISFDYAIKYLLRNKSDYEIIEGFISSILATKGYKPVKIISLLESESNKEEKKDRRSLADVIVEDEDKKKYIIEIERNVKLSFIEKACFNTSRIIVDSIKESADYSSIIKVFHISLLYFPVGKGPIHHGKTLIHEIETNQKLNLHIINKNSQTSYDATEIFPEYFFISIPLFNDRLEKEVDDWLYILKHDEVPNKFRSKYIEKVKERLSILKMTKKQYYEYLNYKKKVIDDREELFAAEMIGKEKGIKEGMEKGKKEKEIEIAKSLLKMDMKPEDIAIATGLSIDEIISLIKDSK